MNAKVACALLAAGASRRLGQPKQLLLYRGQPLVRLAAQAVWQSRASACALVVGAHGAAVRAALGALPFELLDNPDWEQGLASSVRVAAAWAGDCNCDALLLTLCDQPRLSAAHLDRLIAEFERTGRCVASGYAEKNGVPALLPKACFAALAGLGGDAGASRLLNGSLPVGTVAWPEGELDVDTLESAQRLLQRAENERA
ncbi:MAG TPA: nucleotidyltransferase family protein [Polyangiaceae bacterium]|nr:nucleotidyltransferase family protein [Polyangiaceae bacterium]